MATERTSCCDDIVETMGRVDNLEEWRDRFIVESQRARDIDHETNTKAFTDINTKLDNISTKLTSYVSPTLAIIISVLTALVGMLGGALWMAISRLT